MSGFHEVLFPARLAFGSGAGIERRCDITTLGSGFERRISSWALGRRRYLIGAGIRALGDAASLLDFFEARQGQLYGFRFRDFADFKSCGLGQSPTARDQALGIGDGVRRAFALTKAYGEVSRPITKPVSGSLLVALDGVGQSTGFSLDATTGLIRFATPPAAGVAVSAGFLFDTPVRFDTDRIDLTLESFEAGRVAAVGLIEIKV